MTKLKVYWPFLQCIEMFLLIEAKYAYFKNVSIISLFQRIYSFLVRERKAFFGRFMHVSHAYILLINAFILRLITTAVIHKIFLFFASINKIFLLAGKLGARLSFCEVETLCWYFLGPLVLSRWATRETTCMYHVCK